MNWDTEIWAPCRLGEAFTLREFHSEHTEYLYAIKADWMGHRGDANSVPRKEQLEGEYVHPIKVGIGPRPWAKCWTYEPKIKITPPVWCWDMQDDTVFGLDLKPKRNGNRRKAKLDCVMIHKGRPVYCIVVETSAKECRKYYDSIPILDPYFAPIWPATVEKIQEVGGPVPEPMADPVAEAAMTIETQKIVINAPKTEETTPERDALAVILGNDVFARARTNDTQPTELKEDRNEPPQLTDELRRLLTTLNPANLADTPMAQEDEDAPACWTETENRPPGACIDGGMPFSGKYYYYVWFEEPPTKGENDEQRTQAEVFKAQPPHNTGNGRRRSVFHSKE